MNKPTVYIELLLDLNYFINFVFASEYVNVYVYLYPCMCICIPTPLYHITV